MRPAPALHGFQEPGACRIAKTPQGAVLSRGHQPNLPLIGHFRRRYSPIGFVDEAPRCCCIRHVVTTAHARNRVLAVHVAPLQRHSNPLELALLSSVPLLPC